MPFAKYMLAMYISLHVFSDIIKTVFHCHRYPALTLFLFLILCVLPGPVCPVYWSITNASVAFYILDKSGPSVSKMAIIKNVYTLKMHPIHCECIITSSRLSRWSDSVCVGVCMWPEGSTIEWRRHGHHGVDHRHEAEEEHDKQDAHVEVVRAWRFEHSLMRDITAHYSPALEIHGGHQAQNVYTHQSWGIKCTHPKENAQTHIYVSSLVHYNVLFYFI